MATEKKRSKGRFLYLFDWNAKSRKKSEESNQGKESVENSPISQYPLRELHENEDRSSFRGSSNCTSVNGDDGYGTRAPGLVARLMGLDTVPTTSCEASSVSSYENETRAVSNSYYPRDVAAFQKDHHILDYGYAPKKVGGLAWSSVDPRTNKAHGRTIERFQTEVLPPKSAKPISVTHHKLLSPIKSPGFVPTKDAAYIMEAAARIIDCSPHSTGRINITSLSSPSSSFRLQDLKEKMDVAQRSSKILEPSRTPKKSTSMQETRGISSNRSSNRSLFKNTTDPETSSLQKVKSKGKSISVPVRDKAKINRTEGPVYSDHRSQQKEPKQVKLKHKHSSAQKAGQTRTSLIKPSGALRQNNDKQNTVVYKDKSTLKTSFSDQQPRKTTPGDNRAGPSKIVNRVFVNLESGSKKVVTATSAIDKRAPVIGVTEMSTSSNKMNSFSKRKQSAVRENVPANSDERSVQYDRPCQSNSGKDLDVISFTFTSPIKKSGTQSLSPIKTTVSNHQHLDADSSSVNSEACDTNLISPILGLNLMNSGSLSHLLEQKLKELNDKIVSRKSHLVRESLYTDSVSGCPESNSSCGVVSTASMEYNEWSDHDQTSIAPDDDGSLSFISKSRQKHKDFENVHVLAEASGTNKYEASTVSDLSHPNGLLPEYSMSGSCMSSSFTSDFTCGYDQPSSPQSQEETSRVSIESVHPREDEDDSDFAGVSSQWELEYVRHVLHYAGLKRFWLDKHYKIIDPAVFDLLENLIDISGRNEELCSKHERRILFDCIAETISSRYERVFLGSHKAWDKWEMLLHNECLTEDVFKEISGSQNEGILIVDEIVDRDMSSHTGKWQDFEVESLEEGMEIEKEIVASLVDEVVADLYIESFYR